MAECWVGIRVALMVDWTVSAMDEPWAGNLALWLAVKWVVLKAG